MWIVIFKSTSNALLRPGRRNWTTRADMVARAEMDGVVAATAEGAMRRAADFIPGSSGIHAVPLVKWLADHT